MKTADEIAHEILAKIPQDFSNVLLWGFIRKKLTEFGEERVKEARSEKRLDVHLDCLKEMAKKYQEGRAEAIEECAKVVDSVWESNKNCDPEAGSMMEEAIAALRALKNP